MRSLESEANPFRRSPDFYRPHHRKSSSVRRTFPALVSNPITDSHAPDHMISFAGELQKVQYISRGFKHQDIYYPDPLKNKHTRMAKP